MSWRQREEHLLRVLSARNLDQIKATFDRVCVGDKTGLTQVEFLQSLLRLVGGSTPEGTNRQEFCIQVMELFAAIDVRAATPSYTSNDI